MKLLRKVILKQRLPPTVKNMKIPPIVSRLPGLSEEEIYIYTQIVNRCNRAKSLTVTQILVEEEEEGLNYADPLRATRLAELRNTVDILDERMTSLTESAEDPKGEQVVAAILFALSRADAGKKRLVVELPPGAWRSILGLSVVVKNHRILKAHVGNLNPTAVTIDINGGTHPPDYLAVTDLKEKVVVGIYAPYKEQSLTAEDIYTYTSLREKGMSAEQAGTVLSDGRALKKKTLETKSASHAVPVFPAPGL